MKKRLSSEEAYQKVKEERERTRKADYEVGIPLIEGKAAEKLFLKFKLRDAERIRKRIR